MLTIATSSADITPSVPIDLSGFLLRKNPAKSISDPLKVRWLSLCAENGLCALIGAADLLSFSRGTFNSLCDEILPHLGSAHTHIGLATSHTHSGPATVRLRNCGQMNRAYLAKLRKTITDSAKAAGHARPAPVGRVRLGTASCDLNMNRRQGDGGLVDREVTVLSIEGHAGDPLATIVNYACHPVVLGHESVAVSADYPGSLCETIERKTGAPCLFLNGACGDINPVNAHNVDPAASRQMGETLAEVALHAIEEGKEIFAGNPVWYRRSVQLPVRVPESIAEVHERLDHLESRFHVSRSLFASRIKRDELLLKTGRYPKTISLQLSLLALGDEAAILFVPGELFTSIGLRAKELAAPRKLLVSGFSNGSVGYLCDRQAYHDGGYEPYFANFFYDFPEFQPEVEDHVLGAISWLLNASRPKSHIPS